MKKILIQLLLLFSTYIFSQEIKGKIIDSQTNLAIPFATLAFETINKGVFSDSKGDFTLEFEKGEKNIIVTCVGYTKKIISKNDLNLLEGSIIYLDQKITTIDEVFIVQNKIKYTSTKIIKTQKKLKVRTGLPFGYEFSTLIKNKFKKRGRISSVTLSLNEMKNFDYLATYNIKFYEYDTIKKEPGEIIHNRNLIVFPENKTYKLKINLDTLKIPFPKSGICVGVEIMNTKYEGKIKNMPKIAPNINFTHTKNEILTWTRFLNKLWFVYTKKSHFRKDYQNGMIDIEVKLIK